MHAEIGDRSKLRILLVEDDPTVAESVCAGLPAGRFQVDHAASVMAATQVLAVRRVFDAIVLDLSLPDGDGRLVADYCRKHALDIPILMATARDTVNDRLRGLAGGADDYICKPFAVAELGMRIEAVCRRMNPTRRHLLRYDDIELDLLRHRVRRGEVEAVLSAREMDFLAFLISNPEQVLSKERLLKEVWSDAVGCDDNVLHVYVNYLRNKLEAGRYPRILHTVRAVGYCLSRTEPDFLRERVP